MAVDMKEQFKWFLGQLKVTCSLYADPPGTVQELAAAIADNCRRSIERIEAAEREEEEYQDSLSQIDNDRF